MDDARNDDADIKEDDDDFITDFEDADTDRFGNPIDAWPETYSDADPGL